MAKRLTEEMVIARTKISDLGKIKRLNCWGSELVDVSLLRRMPCVEVLSLSINRINSLEDFQFCKRLEELYIRQNDIRDLNQICYLQSLPNLKNLWLGENPCANADGSYRMAVLRALPQLQKLDNLAVTTEELKEAQRKGKVLSHPEDPEPSDEEVEYVPPPVQSAREPTPQYNRYQEYTDQQQQQQEYSPQRSPSRQDPGYEAEETEEYYARVEISSEEAPPPYTNATDELSRRTEPARRNYSPEQEYVDKRRNSYERESPPHYYDRSPQSNNSHPEDQNHAEAFREPRIVASQSTNSIKEYTNGDRYAQQQQVYRHSEPETNYSQENIPQQRRERHCYPAAHRPPFSRRPVTRNSNILSAVLCLVKELDYPSLEVVEVAVRCRMDELDE